MSRLSRYRVIEKAGPDFMALTHRVYEIVGVSQNGAQAEVPKNLESGVALQTHANMQTERFAVLGKIKTTRPSRSDPGSHPGILPTF